MGRSGSGVESRETSIRINFVLDGQPCRERLTLNGKSLPPTPANLKYAARVAADIKRRIAQGVFYYAEFFPDSPRAKAGQDTKTFGALADLWLESKGQLEAATRGQYGNAVELWKRLLGADTPLDKLTHQVLAAKVGGHPWASPKSCNNYLIPLRGILDFEYRGRKALDNPMVGIKNLAVVKRPPDPFTPDERAAILADMETHYDTRVSAYFRFMFFSGLRPEEAIALQWQDIDWNDGIARIQRVRTFRGTERDGSKTHTVRDVDLVTPALVALRAMKAYTWMKGKEDTCVFENPVTGRHWHDERSQRDHYWTPTLKRLGIRHRRAYNTRHTYATAALMAGVNPSYIARQLGHANTAMLFKVYSRWIDGADKGVERRIMEAAMGGGFSPRIPHGKNKTG